MLNAQLPQMADKYKQKSYEIQTQCVMFIIKSCLSSYLIYVLSIEHKWFHAI